MVTAHLDVVLPASQGVGYVERKGSASYGAAVKLLSVDSHRGIRAGPLKLQEISFFCLLVNIYSAAVCRCSVEIAVLQLAVAVIVVPVMWHVDGLCLYSLSVVIECCLPSVIEAYDVTFPFLVRSDECHWRFPHGL